MTLAGRLRAEDTDARVAAIAALRERGAADEDEIAALADCLGHGRKAVQRAAAEAFATLAERGVAVRAVLEAALTSAAARQRWAAAYALARLGGPTSGLLPVLVETLGGYDGDLRWAAADILTGLPDRPAVQAVLRRLVREGNPAQRKMAFYCLRDLEDRTPEVEASALAAVADRDPGVSLAAIASLARLATDRVGAAARLVTVLQTGTERAARAAAAALGTLGERGEPVLVALRRAAASPDPSLRRAARRALGFLGVTGS